MIDNFNGTEEIYAAAKMLLDYCSSNPQMVVVHAGEDYLAKASQEGVACISHAKTESSRGVLPLKQAAKHLTRLNAKRIATKQGWEQNG